jgi:hypothetical protein
LTLAPHSSSGRYLCRSSGADYLVVVTKLL